MTRYHARLQFRLRRVLPPPGLQGAGSEQVPAALGWLPAAARPRLIPEPRSHPRGPAGAAGAGAGAGRGARQGGTWKNHPDCIAVGEAAGGAGSPGPPPRRAFWARGSQVLGPPWAGRCRPGGVRAGLAGLAGRTRVRATQPGGPAPHVGLRKGLGSSEIPPRSSSQAWVFGLIIWEGRWEKLNFIIGALARDSAGLSMLESNLGAPPFPRGLPSSC